MKLAAADLIFIVIWHCKLRGKKCYMCQHVHGLLIHFPLRRVVSVAMLIRRPQNQSSVCAVASGGWWQTRSQNPPSASSQQVNLSFLTQKGWGSLTPHPSLLPSLQFDDIPTAFLLERFGTHKQKWPRLTDKETDQEETVLLFNTVINRKVINTISFCFLLFKSIWGTPWSQITS